MPPFSQKNIATDTAEKMAWLRLIRTENVGPVTFYQLVDNYGSATHALEALPELAARGGRKKPLKTPPLSVIEKEYGRLRKIGGDIMIASDESYPLSLASTSDAPPVISVLGNIDFLREPSIAIVGARNASLNGRKFAKKLASDLGEANHVVASGLARGIDTAAHEGSLQTGTIAVVAGGIDIVYPPENQKLYDEIKESGLIIAESPLGQKPFAQSFPRRNRIVSGLSAGTIVVEATLKSGSLITARLAGEQGRDVFAVPGHPLDPRAAGPNKLIRDGAILVRDANDILESLQGFGQQSAFHLEEPAQSSLPPQKPANDPQLFDDARETVLAHLSFTPLPQDDLIRETGLPIPLLQTILLELELAGRLERLPGSRLSLQNIPANS